MAQIEVRHLSKTFTSKDVKVDALKDINLEIEQGDIYGIIGMSGAADRGRGAGRGQGAGENVGKRASEAEEGYCNDFSAL